MKMYDVKTFYDVLAEEYDTMTSFEKRLLRGEPLFRSIVDKYKIKTSLDAGCGTGFHSILLSKLGVKVTAVDLSDEMLLRLTKNAEKFKVNINPIKSDFLTLPLKLKDKFDAIFCMGNSLAHLNSQSELKKTIKNFYALLNPGGILLIQILNYDRILLKRERIQSIKESDGKTFIRFYDYEKKHIQFNILTIERKIKKIEHKLITTRLRPIKKNEISHILKELNFFKTEYYGGLSLELFKADISQDLVIMSKK